MFLELGIGFIAGIGVAALAVSAEKKIQLEIADRQGVDFIRNKPIVLIHETEYTEMYWDCLKYHHYIENNGDNLIVLYPGNRNRDYVAEANEDMLFADGFDEALIGCVQRAGSPTVALYDSDKCVNILIERDGMTEEEAREFFDFNVLGSYMGENTPAFIEIGSRLEP